MKKAILICLVVVSLVLISGCIQPQTQQCLVEGEEGAMDCCEGLVAAPCADLGSDESQCSIAECGARCINCGDDTCGTGENWCNCPQDCGEAPDGATIDGEPVDEVDWYPKGY